METLRKENLEVVSEVHSTLSLVLSKRAIQIILRSCYLECRKDTWLPFLLTLAQVTQIISMKLMGRNLGLHSQYHTQHLYLFSKTLSTLLKKLSELRIVLQRTHIICQKAKLILIDASK